MKMRLAAAWALSGLAFVCVPLTVLLKTSANDHLRDGKRKSLSIASVFTVTNNLDSGPGSLRDAITLANLNAGADSIAFVSGLGTINVGSITNLPLPNIAEALTIDGGVDRVELNGTSAGSGANGLTIIASGVTVRGLVINRFGGDGISIQASNCIIRNNVIGCDVDGESPLPNFRGILVNGFNNQIGGTSPNDRNVISGNSSVGIELNSASNNTIQGNDIGIGAEALPNGSSGIRTLGTSNNNTIGGTTPGAGNRIESNAGYGVHIFGGSNNSILGNSIFDNQSLGINLGDDPGVTDNDDCDLDTGANGLQNFPVLTSASSVGGTTTITGLLDSTMNASFRVEFFFSPDCDESGFGQGLIFIGATTVTTSSSCVAPINVSFPVALSVDNSKITATATDSANNTSEFSQCVTVTAPQVSDLQITSFQPGAADSGTNLIYMFTIFNNGPNPVNGVTFTDIISSGATFVSLTSTGSCSTPPVGQSGLISCSLGPLSFPGMITITLVVKVTAPPGATITNTATVTSTSGDSDVTNNVVTSFTQVTSSVCTLTCPPDLVVSTTASNPSCASVVTYTAFQFLCGPISCAPPSGSVFAVGNTMVTCSASGAPNCSFNVLVVDALPPRITCSTGFAVPLPAGSSSAVVTYPTPSAIDECGAVPVSCVPPSGSTFPPGATLVSCSARDASENTASCSFFVSVLDAQAPVITCPGNISVSPPAGQAAVVTYPPPTVSDNLPGVSAACSPASGSTFPQGITTVTCTAIDTGGNRVSCSFTVGVGAPQVSIIIPGNKPTVDFTAAPARKVKPKNNPCSSFTIDNIGSSPLVLTLDSIVRTGAAVDSGRITDPNDTRFFSLSLINADQSLTPLDIGGTLTIQPRQPRNICVKFAAPIPALAGKTTGLAAANVLPDSVTSRIVFRQNAGANIFVPLSARVSTALVFVNISNPRAVPEVLFTRSGDDITVSYGIYDSNLDVTRSKYEFLNGSGQVVAGPFEIDLAGSVSSANLLKGQSFSVEQRFTGGSDNPDATGVRVTVFDGETSVVNPTSANTISAASIELMNRTRRVTLLPPSVSLRR